MPDMGKLIRPIPLGHAWSFETCTCGQRATHICRWYGADFAVACEWHAHRWARQA